MNKIHVHAKNAAFSLKMQAVIAVAALFSAYYRLPLPFLFLTFVLLYLLWSYSWTLASCRKTAIVSTLSANKCFSGDILAWDLKFSSSLPFPLARCGVNFLLTAELPCSSTTPLKTSAPFKVEGNGDTTDCIFPLWQPLSASYAWLPGGKEQVVQLQIKAQLRGIYYLPPPHFFTGDPSGLFEGRCQVGSEQFLFVFPRLKNIADFLIAPTAEESDHENRFGIENRYEIQGVRNYQLNDPPKSINWYATARTGSLKSNLYGRKASEYCLVAFDLSAAGHPCYGEHWRNYDPPLEEAISLAAGIALFNLEQGFRTSFLTNAPLLKWVKADHTAKKTGMFMKRYRGITELEFEQGTEQAQNILELCAAIDTASRARPDEQEKLWHRVLDAPAGIFIYLIRYHTPPAGWNCDVQNESSPDPACFYSPQKMAALASSRIRMINLSQERS